MAGPWYVDSAAAGTADGLSWVNACTTMANVLAKAVAAGDTIFVRNTHSESSAATTTWTFPGTIAAPNIVLCATNAAQPPLAANLIPASGTTPPAGGTAATITITGAAHNLVVNGSVYFRGLIFNMGDSTNTNAIQFSASASTSQKCSLCSLNITGTGTGHIVIINLTNGAGVVDLNNCSVSFTGTGQGFRLSGQGYFRWRGGGSVLNAGSAIPTPLFIGSTTGAGGGVAIIEDVDLSLAGTGKTLVDQSSGGWYTRFSNCKLGASVTISANAVLPLSDRVDLIISDSTNTNYRSERYDYCGTQKTSTTVYNNATDGTTPISWQVVTTANSQLQWPFECVTISRWVAAGTYAATVVQCTSATASLTNADIWVEAEYLGSASFPQASVASSGVATPLTAGSALAAGTWATGSLGNNYQLALPSFTVAMAGYVRFCVRVAKPSLTINIDPAVTVA